MTAMQCQNQEIVCFHVCILSHLLSYVLYIIFIYLVSIHKTPARKKLKDSKQCNVVLTKGTYSILTMVLFDYKTLLRYSKCQLIKLIDSMVCTNYQYALS